MTPTAAQTVRALCNAARAKLYDLPLADLSLEKAIAAAEALLAREECPHTHHHIDGDYLRCDSCNQILDETPQP